MFKSVQAALVSTVLGLCLLGLNYAEAGMFTDLRYTFATDGSALGGPGDLTATDIAVTDSANMAVSGGGNNFFIRGDVTDGDATVAVPSALFATTFEPTDYLSWTLTPDAGSVLELDEVSFDYFNEGSGGGTSYSAAFALRSSVDGFASDLTISDGGGHLNNFVPFTDTTVYNAVATLGAAFEGLTSVEFRLFTYGDLGFNAAGERSRIDNIFHEGATSNLVPEPAAITILGVVGSMMACRRRF